MFQGFESRFLEIIQLCGLDLLFAVRTIPYAGRYGTGLPHHNDTGPMDKRIDKFIFCVCHTRKTVQASGSPMFFLLLKRPPTPGDHTGGVWAALARACARSSRGDGQTVVIPTSRRAADVVASPWHRDRAAGGLQAVLGALKCRSGLPWSSRAQNPPISVTRVPRRQKMQKRSRDATTRGPNH